MKWCRLWTVAMGGLSVAGCATVQDNLEAARAAGSSARAQEVALYTAPPSAAPASLRVDEYLTRARERDLDVARLETEIESGRLQVDGSRSLNLPRVSLRSSVDVPLDKGHGYDDRQVNGGLLVDYDLMRAMFSDAETAVAQARMRQSMAEHERAARQVEWRMIRFLLKREQSRESERIAADGTLVASLAEEGLTEIQGGGSEAWRWRSELEAKRSAQRLAAAESERTVREINRRLDLPEETVLDIPDLADLLAHLDVMAAQIPELREMVQVAMAQDERLEVAETRLFLAGMSVEKARRSRWPSVSVGVGVGQFYLPERDETAHVIGQLQISYPLFDAGDRARDVQAAELQKSRAGSEVRETSASVAAEVSGAWRDWRQARAEMDAAEQWLQQVDARIGMVGGDGGISETAELRMLKLGAQTRWADSRYRLRDATAAVLQASGQAVDVLKNPQTPGEQRDADR